jgi:hypothetical protein
MSQVRIPTHRPLPDPRRPDMKIDAVLRDYLVAVNEEIQAINRDFRVMQRETASGTFVYDDGATGRVTVVITQGRIQSVTVAASSGATMTWT